MIGAVVNRHTLLWFAKWFQRWILDPLLDLVLGMTTLGGWRNERAERRLESRTRKLNSARGRGWQPTFLLPTGGDDCKFEKSAHLVKVWWKASPAETSFKPPDCRKAKGGKTSPSSGANNLLSSMFYTHLQFVSPSIVINCNSISIRAICDGFVLFDVKDNFVTSRLEMGSSGDGTAVKLFQTFVAYWSAATLWGLEKVCNIVWRQERIVIVPQWAFNHLLSASNPRLLLGFPNITSRQELRSSPEHELDPSTGCKFPVDKLAAAVGSGMNPARYFTDTITDANKWAVIKTFGFGRQMAKLVNFSALSSPPNC